MALKKKIDKATFDKLPEHFKSEYIADGEDGYKLDVDGEEDVGALKRALIREKAEKGTSKERIAELEAALEEITTSDARKNKDITTLEKGWQKKLDEQKENYESRLGKLTAHTTKNLGDNVALSLAQKLSPKSPKVLLPHIRQRIVVDFDGDEPASRILGVDGKVSNMTIDQLEAEFIANSDFGDIIIGSKASGGAGKVTQSPNGGAGAFNNNPNQPADLSKIAPAALVAHLKEVKANKQD